MQDPRQYSAPAMRNRGPILEVLRRVSPARGKVLEIASGSGEHAVFFAAALPGLAWFPSDPDAAARASIAAWIAATQSANVRPPADIDVRQAAWGVEREAPFDMVVSCNMVHIAPWACTLGLMAGAARVTGPGGLLLLYGPFKRGGAHTAPSNEAFDASLRERNPEWGVRDMEAIIDAAAAQGFALREVVTMPANNFALVLAQDEAPQATSH
ncbi:MAG TPA: DUF938 domain-containing protein [Caulobacterales bacterium]|nr:DUF938 domain-containing protein [Caulobacterales bacterium]